MATASGRSFGQEELELAESLADQVASVIGRARIFDEQSTIAHLLQRSLLPAGLDEVPGVAVAARYVPSSRMAEVGGDFYDVVALSHGKVALVIGDVEGHDMRAATVMGQLRNALRAYLLLTSDPGRALSLLDGFARAQSIGRMTTACLAVLDTTDGSLELASAGHPPPYLVVGHTEATAISVRPGTPLGVGHGDFPVTRRVVPPGAHLVFYTDGLIDGGRNGYELPEDLFSLSPTDSPSRACEKLADAVLHAATPGPGIDDIAVLVVGWTPQQD